MLFCFEESVPAAHAMEKDTTKPAQITRPLPTQLQQTVSVGRLCPTQFNTCIPLAAFQTVIQLIGIWFYGVHWTCTETAAVSCDTSHVIKQRYNHFAGCIQKALFQTTDTTCGHKANGITPLITWRKGVFKEEVPDDLPWNDKWGLLSVWWTLEPFQRQC